MRNLIYILAASFALPLVSNGQESDENRKQPVTTEAGIVLGKETTIVEGPLRNGVIDFFAVLNERGRQGVTADNNAAVVFWQAMGPKHSYFEGVDVDRFYEMLGVEVPDSEGAWVEFSTFVEQEGATEENSRFLKENWNWPAVHQSWKAEDYPLIHKWLVANEQALNKLKLGLQRDKWYAPAMPSMEEGAQEDGNEEGAIPAMLITATPPAVQANREVARALIARGMLRSTTGQAQQGWQDVLACHRLARHCGVGTSLIELLVGHAIESLACDADAELARLRLPANQYSQMLADLRGLPPSPGMKRVFELGERFFYIDAVMHLSIGHGSEAMLGGQPMIQKLAASAVDWNETLKIGNEYYDKILTVMDAPNHQEMLKRHAVLKEELEKLAAERPSALGLAAMLLAGSTDKHIGRSLGKVLVALLLPASQAAITAETRTLTKFDVTVAGLAVAEYRARQGVDPPSLRAVGIETKDGFSDKPIVFRSDAKGCVVYSVGQDLDDDNGVAIGENPDDPLDGDLVVRLPALQ